MSHNSKLSKTFTNLTYQSTLSIMTPPLLFSLPPPLFHLLLLSPFLNCSSPPLFFPPLPSPVLPSLPYLPSPALPSLSYYPLLPFLPCPPLSSLPCPPLSCPPCPLLLCPPFPSLPTGESLVHVQSSGIKFKR